MTRSLPSSAAGATGATELAEAAQRVAGILAARHRGDPEGVATLMASFPDGRALAGGALLLTRLLLELYGDVNQLSVEECVQELITSLARVGG